MKVMKASDIIREMMEIRNMPIKDVAKKMGITPQVFSNRLYRDSFTYNDYIRVAEALDFNVFTISKDEEIKYKNKYYKKLTRQEVLKRNK